MTPCVCTTPLSCKCQLEAILLIPWPSTSVILDYGMAFQDCTSEIYRDLNTQTNKQKPGFSSFLLEVLG